jgi:transposase
MGFRRSNCSLGAARRGSLPGRTRARPRQRARPVDLGSGIIEVEIGGVSVRVGRGAGVETVAVVIRALKAGT